MVLPLGRVRASWGAAALLLPWPRTFFVVTLHPAFQVMNTGLIFMPKLSLAQCPVGVLFLSGELTGGGRGEGDGSELSAP